MFKKKYKIIKKNPYTADKLEGLGIIIESKWNDSFIDIISKNKIKHLFLNHSFGWMCDDYSFLISLYGIKTIDIIDVHSNMIQSIESQSNLESLSLNLPEAYEVDFSKFRFLKSLFCYGRKPNGTLYECDSLEELYIDEYKCSDSRNLGKLSRLKNLTIANSNLTSLSFLTQLSNLTSLSLLNCRSLLKFEEISSLTILKRLEIRGSKIHDISFLHDSKMLEILIIESDYLDSISPLQGLISIKALALIGSKMLINDGDLSAIKSLRNLSMLQIPNKRTYQYKIHNYWNWKEYGMHSQIWLTPK